MKLRCGCLGRRKLERDQCELEATQEDLLCDGCRAMGCEALKDYSTSNSELIMKEIYNEGATAEQISPSIISKYRIGWSD